MSEVTVSVRNVPEITRRRFKALAAERTRKEKGARIVPVNELYVEALNNYVGRGKANGFNGMGE